MISRNIRAIIFPIRFFNITWWDSSLNYLRKITSCNFYIEKIFIILEKNIIFWLMFFDEIVFKNQWLSFIIRNNIFYFFNISDHFFLRKVEFLLTRKIAIDSWFEIFRFPNINYFSSSIKILINPRRVREICEDVFNIFFHVNILLSKLYQRIIFSKLNLLYIYILGNIFLQLIRGLKYD